MKEAYDTVMKTSFFDRSVTRVSSLFNLIASASLFFMIMLTCSDVFMRYFFNRPIAGAYDLVGLMGAVLVSFAMPYTMLVKGHVAVEILMQNLSRGKQVVIETGTHVLAVLLFLMLLWQSLTFARHMKSVGEVTPTLHLPFYPILYCMAVCFFVLCLTVVVNLLRIWMKGEE